MSLLREIGYRNLRIYPGGMEDWTRNGGPIERASLAPQTVHASRARRHARARIPTRLARSGSWFVALVDALAARSVAEILASWLGMVLAFGGIYWIAGLAGGRALVEGGVPVGATWRGLGAALYFSFVTATSVGYGDVVPVGAVRMLAIAEAAAGLLIFGFLISRFVSRRQEELVAEIHRIAFESRLDRVQTNLHLVLSEVQAISGDCANRSVPPSRVLARAESATMVFAGELRTVHDLLYRPQQVPEEEVLEAILANLASAFGALCDLVDCLPEVRPRPKGFLANLRTIARLGSEICGECVPREYAPALKEWMDRVQERARGLQASATT